MKYNLNVIMFARNLKERQKMNLNQLNCNGITVVNSPIQSVEEIHPFDEH